MKRQRATLTLIDEGEGFRASVQYQPSLKNRTLGEDSPSINAMVRICLIIARAKGAMGAPLVPKKPLTIREKVHGFFHGLRQKRNTNPPTAVVEAPPRLEAGVLEEGAPSTQKGNTK